MFKFGALTICLSRFAISADRKTIQCPTLECTADEDLLPQDVCWRHDGEQPTSKMYARACGDQLISGISGTAKCEFDLRDFEYAWVDEVA